MEIRTSKKDINLIVKINGEIDSHSADIAREKIDTEFREGSFKNIIFDFSEVSFMDSSGIGMIIGRYKEVGSLGGKVAVVGANGSSDKIFRASGLYRIIKPYTNVKEALKAI